MHRRFVLSVFFVILCITIHGQQSISPKTLNLGEISRADIISKDLKLTNMGAKPVIITNVSLSTGKLKVNYQKEPILPGDSGIINVTLYTQDLESGLFSTTFRVRTNGRPSSFRIAVNADVSDKIPPRQNRKDGIQWVRIYSNDKFGAEIESNIVIRPIYESLSYNSILQLFIGIIGNQLDLLDTSGKIIVRTKYQEYNVDRNGIILKNDNLMGYIRKDGKMIIPFNKGFLSINHVFDKVGEYFQFWYPNSIGILDKNGNITIELPEIPDIPNEHRRIVPYYISNKLIFLSNDGIYDLNCNKLASFGKVSRGSLFSPFILDNGDIAVFELTEENPFNHIKIGSIFDLKVQNSINPYK